MTGLVRLLLLLSLLAGPATAQTSDDPRLTAALEQAEVGNLAGARSLAQAVLDDATTAEGRWFAKETLATIAHWWGQDAVALDLLGPLLDEGAALFGPESPRLIHDLRMLGQTHFALGNEAAAIRSQLRAVVLARTNGEADFETQLLTMADLARSYLDAGHADAAALLAAEAQIIAANDDGSEHPAGQEARALRSLAHLRLDHPVEAVLHALPLYRTDPAELTAEATELLDLIDAELAEAAALVGDAQQIADGWVAEAQAREPEREAADIAMTDALVPLFEAFERSDVDAADAAGRAALQSVLADDALIVNVYFALLSACLGPEHLDKAVAWANRLAEIPPEYLASLKQDPAVAFSRVTDWLLDQGRYADAVALASAMVGLSKLRDGDGSLSLQRHLDLLGAALRKAGRLAEAEAVLLQAIETADLAAASAPLTGERATLMVQSLVELGLSHEIAGRTAEAEDAYTRALATLQSSDAGNDSAGWSFVLQQLGALYTSTGRFADAEALLQQSIALKIARDGENNAGVALAYYELGRLQVYSDQIEAATATAQKALDIGRAVLPPGDLELAALLSLQAAVLNAAGRSDEARSAEIEAAGLQVALTETGSPSDRAAMLMQQGMQLARDGATEDGRAVLAQALTATVPQDPLYPLIQAADGATALLDGDLQSAIAAFRPATLALTQPGRRTEAEALEHLPLHVDTARRLSEQESGVAALNYMAEAFAVAQRVNEISAGQALDKAAARLRGGSAELSDLARDLEAATQAIQRARADLLADLGAGGDGASQRTALDAAQAEFATVQAAIETGFPRYAAYANPKPNDLLATMQLLRPDEVLVLFATSDIFGFNDSAGSTVIAITNEGYIAAGLPPRAELQALARGLRCAAALTDRSCGTGAARTRGAFNLEAEPDEEAPAEAFDLDLAYLAYDTLLYPVSDAFTGKTSLIVVPDKALAALPFHLMLTQPPQQGAGLAASPWLIRQMAVTIVPTVASLASLRGADARPSAASLPFLGIGDPLIGTARNGALPYDCDGAVEPGLFAAALLPAGGVILRDAGTLATPGLADGATLAALSALPDTRCELQATARLFGTPDALLLQGAATEGRIKALSASGDLLDYRILSFATHGLIAGEIGANNAGLVLTPPARADAEDDGLLTTAEIANLRLDADFVLLSACNTAAGATSADEGLSGLASAFFLAGARSLLVSHWPVYSDGATRLTTGLFAALEADPGIGRAEALRRAMLAVLDDPDATPAMLHPAWWGPFMIAGEGSGA